MNALHKTSTSLLSKTEQDSINDVTQKITQHSNELRKKYRLLGYQNVIGASVMTLSVTGMIIMGTLYIKGIIPAWLCIVTNALLTSLIHELEHDLIHRLYFRKQPFAHNLMMLLCWITRRGCPALG